MIVDLGRLLNSLHDSEINGAIDWLYDGEWTVTIGAPDGYDVKESCRSIVEAAEWLRGKAAELYPNSVFAKAWV